MATVSSQPSIGPLLREWRDRRRLTQLELALDAGISTRHLSFVETGRSRPGREMLLRILEQLEVPFREQNRLLLTSGHAPYPAVVVDRAWNLVAANSAMRGLIGEVAIDPALLEPPVNALRVSFHPRGL